MVARFQYLNPHLHDAQALTVEGILAWRDKVLRTTKPITWNGYVRHMRSVYNFGMENGFLHYKKNPFTKTLLRTGKEKRKTLTVDQLQQIDQLLSSDHQLPSILRPR